jgi:tRNA A37 threonylcarbamoyladenosine dehydratase
MIRTLLCALTANSIRLPSRLFTEMHSVVHRSNSPIAVVDSESKFSDDTDYYALRFDGIRRLYGQDALQRLRTSCVVVVGLGGVGTWCVEALARSGIGSLVLIDLDEICISNTNRQIHALSGTVGRSKACELKARVLDINPECYVRVREQWVTEENAMTVLSEELSVATSRGEAFAVCDAVDGYKEKAAMIAAGHALDVHLVTSGGAGGRSDPTSVRVADVVDATQDSLIRAVRKRLRQQYGFPRGPERGGQRGKPFGITCVYSVERERPADEKGTLCDRFGTACFGTGPFGFAAAAALVRMLATDEPLPERPTLVLVEKTFGQKLE